MLFSKFWTPTPSAKCRFSSAISKPTVLTQPSFARLLHIWRRSTSTKARVPRRSELCGSEKVQWSVRFFYRKTALTLGLWMKKIITTMEYEWIWSICTVCTCIKNMYKQLQNLGFLLVGGFERSFDPGKPSYSTAGGVDDRQGLKKALAATKVFRVWKWGVTLLKSRERSETDDSPMDANKGIARTDRYG